MAVQYRVTHLLADLGQPNLVREEMGHPVLLVAAASA